MICAVQAQNMSKLAVLQDEQHGSETRLAELRQQLDTQQARLQSQVRCRHKHLPMPVRPAAVASCLSVCMYVCTYVRTYVCMYVRMYVCMYDV